MRADVGAGPCKLGPEPGMSARAEQIERERGKGDEDSLDERLPARKMLRIRAVNAVEELRGGDRGYPNLLVLTQLACEPGADLLES